MRPALWALLAVAVAAAAYVSSQGDDELVAAHGQGNKATANRSGSRGDANEKGAPGSIKASARAASSQKGAGRGAAQGPDGRLLAVQTALVGGVQQWQQREARSAASLDAEGAQAWAALLPPPPPEPPAMARQLADTPPPPMAPPFPHKWIGRFNDEPVADASAAQAVASSPVNASHAATAPSQAVQRVVVAGPSSIWVLREGDVIEGQWRVDHIDIRTMTLTYLPLKLTQTVAMNGS
jgi:hypothetical protein